MSTALAQYSITTTITVPAKLFVFELLLLQQTTLEICGFQWQTTSVFENHLRNEAMNHAATNWNFIENLIPKQLQYSAVSLTSQQHYKLKIELIFVCVLVQCIHEICDS